MGLEGRCRSRDAIRKVCWSAFHSGQMRTKNNSRNVDVREGLRERIRPGDPCRVVE